MLETMKELSKRIRGNSKQVTPNLSVSSDKEQTKLKGMTDIYRFFRDNDTPIYFISPTAYNILGLGQWINAFNYITHFDSFDGGHFRVLNPKMEQPRDFESMEDLVNYLVSHKDSIDMFERKGSKGKILTVMFDETTEQLAKELDMEIALPSHELRKYLDSKIVTTRLANEANVLVPLTYMTLKSQALKS